MIVPGSASQDLAATLSAALGESLAAVEYEQFADGERVVRVPDTDDRAVVVASTVSDGAHVELLQLQDAARQQAEEVVTVLPYMGYARQDEAFAEGEPVSARAMARAISTGTDRVLTVNPHENAVCDFFDVPCRAVDAAGLLADTLPALSDPLFLSPDEGAIDLAKTVRDTAGDGEVDYFEKHRLSDTEVEMQPSDADTAGRDVVLVDDIVATGSTMSTAIAQLDDPDRVFVTCVHPMLAASARTKLARVGVDGVFGTDTIERAVSTVSVAPALAEHL
ncbi:ribose-phosphate diphosphokinase [Natronomonas gomsonensis]|jgi:ribose-phosphate pyrophosphokinase|uniref:ribose-phosphate diphosphokinase n=1 Tax=Natronomonas gomsonensis TaxID=1046043 RepID=UPI0020CA922F|nr:ribose-phosphate diphosphokinase [Natronomonas gomsonensis]MCY4729903.1 ribose-phosphate diphosphokinase [Natronomonas gomsonensis]